MTLSMKKSELENLDGVAGVYGITNTITNKHYIGATFNLKRRYLEHKNRSTNKELRKDIEKYGTDNFTFVVLAEHMDPTETGLSNCEKFHIQMALDLNRNLYNTYTSGKVTKMTQEQKDKISNSHIGLKKSDEIKEKCGKINRKPVMYNGIVYESQTALAREIGIPQQVISLICNGLIASTYNIQFVEE